MALLAGRIFFAKVIDNVLSMMTMCGFDPVLVRTGNEKTLHTREPRLEANATRTSPTALEAPSAKQLLAMEAEHPFWVTSKQVSAFKAVLEILRDKDIIRNDFTLGPVINSTGSTLQPARDETFHGAIEFADVLGTTLCISLVEGDRDWARR
ncbi:hypothetical protein SLS61_003241 [Didymella pomorum]